MWINNMFYFIWVSLAAYLDFPLNNNNDNNNNKTHKKHVGIEIEVGDYTSVAEELLVTV